MATIIYRKSVNPVSKTNAAIRRHTRRKAEAIRRELVSSRIDKALGQKPERRKALIAKRLNFDYTIWTENKLSVSQPISLFLLFACAHLCSIGLRSGEYVGKYSTIYPASMMTC